MENMDSGHGNEKDQNTKRKKKGGSAFLLLVGIGALYLLAQSIFSLRTSGPAGGFLDGWLSASQSEEQPREETPRPQDEEETKAQENLNENVKLEERLLPRQLLLLGTNENEVDVSVNISVVFYDEAGKMMTAEEAYAAFCGPGAKLYETVYLPKDANGQPVSFDHYEVYVTAEERNPNPEYADLEDQLTITANVGLDGKVLAKVENGTGAAIDQVELACLYYQGDQTVGFERDSLNHLEEVGIAEFNAPADAAFQPVAFDSFEVVVVSTVRYDV